MIPFWVLIALFVLYGGINFFCGYITGGALAETKDAPSPESAGTQPHPKSTHKLSVGHDDYPPYFGVAQDLAEQHGMTLVRHCATHYALTSADGDIWNLWPTTGKIMGDINHRGPFLKVKRPWTFLDVVKAAIEAKARVKV